MAHADAVECSAPTSSTTVAVDVARWVRLARLVLDEERRAGADAELSLIFVDEQTIADLNERFLGGDGPTDVLAFPIDDDLAARRPPARRRAGAGPGAPAEPGDPPIVLGDVVVCPAVAAARRPSTAGTLDDELALLVVHGVLHLLDYDHAEPSARRRRCSAENASCSSGSGSVDEPSATGPRSETEAMSGADWVDPRRGRRAVRRSRSCSRWPRPRSPA